jgi:hypothetical protein
VAYLKMWGITAGAWQLARSAHIAAQRLAEARGDAAFLRAKIATAKFYAANLLPQAAALARTVTEGSAAVLELPAEQF